MSGQRPSLISRLITRVLLVVGFVFALWLGIHMAAQHPPDSGSADVGGNSPWHAADPSAEARGGVVHR
jgi:fumarate reductase subunit D